MKELDEVARREAILWAKRQVAGTYLDPDAHEVALLESYTSGTLTLDQLISATDHYLRLTFNPLL